MANSRASRAFSVEVQLPGITQVQVNAGIGYTFNGFDSSSDLDSLSTSMDNATGGFARLNGNSFSAPTSFSELSGITVEAPDAMRLRQSPATQVRRNVLVTRDINRMFEGLDVKESVLLKSNARETLFRKPS